MRVILAGEGIGNWAQFFGSRKAKCGNHCTGENLPSNPPSRSFL